MRPWVLVFLALLLPPGFAGASAKSIEQVFPRFGQRGTSVEVEIRGIARSLENPREIVFFKPGIRATNFRVAERQPSRRSFAHGGYLDAAITCTFEIDPDCEPGQHPFRLLTATELSHVATFHVTPFPTVDESPAPKDTPDKAMSVAPDVTINGLLGPAPDHYRVAVRAGQRLSVELDSVRIAHLHYGDSEYDLAVRILDGDGKQIAANDDNSLHIQDPVLSALMPRDGEVIVVVERSVAQPAESVYALHIGTNRRPLVAFPPGAPAGTKQSFRFLGDASGAFDEVLEVPAVSGNFPSFGDAPSPVRLRSSPFPNVLEEPGDAPTPVPALPVALNGIIDSRDDVDRFRLTVKKGEPLHLRVFAAALGSPIDPFLRLRTPAGEIELESDDAPLPDRDIFGTSYRAKGGRPETLDPSIIWKPAADGEYVLEISDPSGAGGPTGIYRVEIEPPRTVVHAVLRSTSFDWAESTRNTGLAVPREGRCTVNVLLPAGQWNPVPGAFDLVARGLPDGVTLTALRVEPGTTLVPLQFVAGANAKPGGAVITLEAKPVDPAVQVESRCEENIPFLNHSGGDALHHVQVDRFVLGVTDPAPFTLDVDPPRAVLVRGGELALPVRVTRRPGFEGPVEYWVRFVDPSVSPQPPTVIPPGETTSLLRMSASARAPLGEHPLAVVGRSLEEEIPRSYGAGDLRDAAEILRFTIAEPYVELTARPASVRRGERTTFRWAVRHHTPFPGEARARLLGLPKGVRVVGEDPVLTAGTPEIGFAVEATDEALLGQVTGLNCEVVLTVAGQEVIQRSGTGTLRIDPAVAGPTNAQP